MQAPTFPRSSWRGRLRLWTGAAALGSLLAPGFNAFEAPEPGSLIAFARTGQFGLAAPPQDPKLGVFFRGAGGRYYPHHEPGSLFLLAPAARLVVAVADHTRLGARQLFGLLSSAVGVLFFATTVVMVGRIAARFGMDEIATARRFLLLTLSSQYLIYAGVASDVSVSAFLLVLAVAAWLRAEEGALAGWWLLGLAVSGLVIFKLSNGAVLPVALLLAATWKAPPRSRGAALLGVAAGSVPGIAILGWWNWLRLGAPIARSYPAQIAGYGHTSRLLGLAGTLVSPGKGLLVYTPALILLAAALAKGGLLRTRPRFALLLFGSWGIALARIGLSAVWSSAGGWGIRYYVTWLPVALLVCAHVWHRWAPLRGWRKAAVALLLVLGAVVNLSGVAANWLIRQSECGLGEWTWRAADTCAIAAMPGNLARIVGAGSTALTVPNASEAFGRASNELATWWYGARFAGAPVWLSWMIGCGLAAVAAWALIGRPLRRGGSDRADEAAAP